MLESRRVVFVHAHPDDESISTGGTIALLGERAHVLTCTRGELGEVIPPSLRTLPLAPLREAELATALDALGATGEFLEHASSKHYSDSGMQWGPRGAIAADESPANAFALASLDEVVAAIATVLAREQPDAVVSYDADGGYGHPDHVRAHEAARAAADAAGLPFYAVSPSGSLRIDVSRVLDRKRAALAAHRTQLVVGDDWFELSNGTRHPIERVESYSLLPTRIGGQPTVKGSSIQ
jgi:N-acetyl-1-D-myo-inositol-2-amino-2-deoxy-alpha-D-glucopyranoside deacetylase